MSLIYLGEGDTAHLSQVISLDFFEILICISKSFDMRGISAISAAFCISGEAELESEGVSLSVAGVSVRYSIASKKTTG